MRAAILEAALGLYRAGGYAGVAMRAVADQLGIQAPSLYHYFVSKEAIFRELQEQTLSLLVETLRPSLPDPLEDMRQYYWRYYEFSKAHPDRFALTWVDASTPQFDWRNESPVLAELVDLGHRGLRRSIEAGLLPAHDLFRASNVLWSAAHGAAVLAMRAGPGGDALAADVLDTAIAGLSTRPLSGRTSWKKTRR